MSTRSTVKINLRADKNSPLFKAFDLSLTVRESWWVREKMHEKFAAGNQRFFITMDQMDLFVPYYEQPSVLTLFGKKITLARTNRHMKVQVNITVEVPNGVQTYRGADLGFDGIVTSGSIVFENLTQTFAAGEWEWLTKNIEPSNQLLLGSSKIQLKLPSRTKVIHPSLYEFEGLIDESENIKCLWKQIDCPHERTSSPSSTLKTHEEKIKTLLEKQAHSHSISIETFEQPDSGIYKLVGLKDGVLFEKIYLKPRLKIYIFQEGSTQSALTWIPQSLVIPEENTYTLYDYNQIEELLTLKRLPSESENFELTVEWKNKVERKVRFPTTHLFPSHTSNPNAMHTPHLWQKGRVNPDVNSFKWIRHTLEEFPTTNEINENSSLLPYQSKTIRGSLLKFNGFNSGEALPWKILINLPKRHAYESVKKSQLCLSITGQNATLKINSPDILAASPQITFYGEPLTDPSSMPPDRIWNQNLVSTPLIFRSLESRANSTRSYKMELNDVGSPTFSCFSPTDNKEIPLDSYVHPLLTYDLAPLAIVDRVSPSRNNLKPPERDPNHSLIPNKVMKFEYDFLASGVVLNPTLMQIDEKYGTEALLPWVERGFNTTGSQQTLYHRNLILEHAEFELGEAYLDKDTNRTSYNASEAFIRATRDRYCVAAQNLANTPSLENWFDHLTLTHNGQAITSSLHRIEPNTRDRNEDENKNNFPKVEISWEKGSEKIDDLTQTLSIDPSSSKWLDYNVKPVVSDKDEIVLDLKKSSSDGYQRVLNSHSPLLFESTKSIDNLGVIRKPSITINDWVIQEIKSEKKYISLSTSNLELSEGEIFFTADALLLKLEESRDPNLQHQAIPPFQAEDFHKAKIHLGAFGFYSNITAPSQDTSFAFADHWPRYKGVPFYVTKIDQFELNKDFTPASISFDALLLNPFDPKNTFRSTRVVKFRYYFGTSLSSSSFEVLSNSGVDWWLSSSPNESNHPISGRLTRLLADVQIVGNKIELSNFLKPQDRHIEAMGGFWGLEELPLLLRSNTTVSNQTQTLYEFHSQPLQNANLVEEGSGSRLEEEESSSCLVEEGSATCFNASKFIVTSITRSASLPQEYYGCLCYINDIPYIILERSQSNNSNAIYYTIDTSLRALPKNLNQFSYQIKEEAYLFLSATPSIPTRKLHCHLPFNMRLSTYLSDTNENLDPILSNNDRLILYLKNSVRRTQLLQPKIIQGNTYGFLFQQREKSMLLWLERGELASLVVSNLTTSSQFTSFCIEDESTPCTKSFLAGIQVHYLAAGHSWRRYSTVSTILTFSNYTLRFDDQIIPDPKNDFPTSEHTIHSTAYLEFDWTQGHLQGPILVHFTRVNDETLAIHFPKQWFSLTAVQTYDESTTQPDIQFMSGSTRKKYILKRALPKREEKQEFVTFEFQAGRLVFKKVPDHLVPLNFCLEPNAIVRTSKLKKSSPQLVHRQVFGTMMRIDLTQQIYLPERNDQEDYDLYSNKNKWRLNPIAKNLKEQPVVMSDDAWLKEDLSLPSPPSNKKDQLSCETESVLILNRPPTIEHHQLPYVALSNRTLRSTPLSDKRKKEIRKQVLEMGINGIILHRTLTYNDRVLYNFVPSPFYSSSSSSHSSSTTHSLSQINSTPRRTHIDFRSLDPKKAAFIRREALSNAYVPFSPSTELQVDLNACTPMRRISYQYQGDMQENHLENHSQPSLYLFETPAYTDMDPLWFAAADEQITTHQQIRNSHYFLPYQLSIQYGPDKAGALFHHEIRNVTHRLTSQLHLLGHNVDFAMRDPQRIKTEGCITAAIEALEVEEKTPQNNHYSSKIYKAEWEDVFGRVDLSNLSDNYRFAPHNLDRFEYRVEHEPGQLPLKIIVHHNFDVYELLDLEATLPAYYDEEKENDGNDDTQPFSWASYYLARTNEACLPNNLPIPEEIVKPDGEEEILNFNFTPFLMVAKVQFSAFENNEITLKKKDDANFLRQYGPDARLFIPGLHARMTQDQSLPLAFEYVEGERFRLPAVDQLYEFSDEKNLYVVYPLINIEEESSSSYFITPLQMQTIPFIPGHSHFQIMWIASANRTTDNGIVKQAASCKFYSTDKIVKGLMKSLTPKIAGVIEIGDSVKKTLFFGNGASSDQAQYSVESASLKLYADDEEEVEIALPSQSLSLQKFYLLKYLVHGQVVSDFYPPSSN